MDRKKWIAVSLVFLLNLAWIFLLIGPNDMGDPLSRVQMSMNGEFVQAQRIEDGLAVTSVREEGYILQLLDAALDRTASYNLGQFLPLAVTDTWIIAARDGFDLKGFDSVINIQSQLWIYHRINDEVSTLSFEISLTHHHSPETASLRLFAGNLQGDILIIPYLAKVESGENLWGMIELNLEQGYARQIGPGRAEEITTLLVSGSDSVQLDLVRQSSKGYIFDQYTYNQASSAIGWDWNIELSCGGWCVPKMVAGEPVVASVSPENAEMIFTIKDTSSTKEHIFSAEDGAIRSAEVELLHQQYLATHLTSATPANTVWVVDMNSGIERKVKINPLDYQDFSVTMLATANRGMVTITQKADLSEFVLIKHLLWIGFIVGHIRQYGWVEMATVDFLIALSVILSWYQQRKRWSKPELYPDYKRED